MFKNWAGVFYWVLNYKVQPSGFRCDKTRAASCSNSLKNIPQKACVLGVRTKVQIILWGEDISIQVY